MKGLVIFGPAIVRSWKLDRSINKVKEWSEGISDRDSLIETKRKPSGDRLSE